MVSVSSALSKNRAEELGYDVWSSFVVPPFFSRLGVFETRKPTVIVGGRGCGKTMLLRYLSHQSAFSRKRSYVPETALLHVGLYWRADTQFANAMQRRGVVPETWVSAFDHFATLLLTIELLRSLRSIAESSSGALTTDKLSSLRFSSIQTFAPDLPSDPESLEKALQTHIDRLEAWVSDVRKLPEPSFIPSRSFLRTFVREIRDQVPDLRSALFFVYVDEYENLVEYQQELVNTWVKSSEDPLIFNLAMKRNGFRTRKTLGAETLTDLHDFRQHDIEQYLEDDFPAFAAEILGLRLAGSGGVEREPAVSLNDPEFLSLREKPEYKSRVIRDAESLLPDVSHEQMAQEVFAVRQLTQKLRERIDTALKSRGSDRSVDDYFRPEAPQASIITPALLWRKSLKVEEVAEELERYISNRSPRFADWIHNNFVGCLLQLYEPYSRACPFYAGFNTYCQLAHGNLRYFLELCYRCLGRQQELSPTPIDVQAEVARQAGAAFLREIRSFGPKGNQLHSFVLGLGSLFALAHLRDTQSESEQTHFFVKEGRRGLDTGDRQFLDEAVKWSVLFEAPATKQKGEFEPEGLDYILNPIYSPYFHISYRKRRKLDITASDLRTLINGEYTHISELLCRYRNTWDIVTAELPLFAHLEDRAE